MLGDNGVGDSESIVKCALFSRRTAIAIFASRRASAAPDTEMCSFAEGEMCSGIDSVEVHHLWFDERLGVAVRRTPQQYEMTAGGQCHATECRVRVDMSVMSAKG